MDSAGDIFIADTGNNRIREVNYTSNYATSTITTVAGSGNYGYNGDGIAATAAELWNPFGVAVDAAGDLFIADAGNQRIREFNAATGMISTVAGDGTSGYDGDGIAATAAELWNPIRRRRGRRGGPLHRRHRQLPHPRGHRCHGQISTVAGDGGLRLQRR